MSSQTTQGSGVTNNNGGSVLHGGDVNSSRFRNLTARNNSAKYYNWGLPSPSPFGGFQAAQLGNAVSITAITQRSSTGYVNIEKSSHGLALGANIVVYGADVAGYNTVHTVTEVVDSNNVKTNVFYSADTSTHGSYKPFAGNFNSILAGAYISQLIGKDTSGNSLANLRIPGAATAYRTGIFTGVGNNRYHITSWNAVTGAATKGGSAGGAFTYVNASTGSALASEPKPTRAAPGRVVFGIGTNVPTRDSYNTVTGY